MKRTLLIIALISIATCQVVNKSEVCSCALLLTSGDCGRNTNCVWNSTKLVCEVPQNTGPVTVPKNYGKSLYCEGLAQTECLKLNECAWIDNKCTFFTSCTPYEKTSKDECQAISKRCITDGQICVEIDLCSTYLTSTSCTQSKTNYCVWDDIGKKCSDVTECSQLPTSLTKDSECRLHLKKECTAKQGGGCVESGTNCEDQVSEEGCVTNKTGTVQCFWGNGKCYEKKCEFALTTNRSHADCQLFSSKCTAKENGGCVDITTCQDGKISEGCKIDNAKKECYWSVSENKCKDKTCVNAPNTLKTNSDCQKQFLATCITNGAGCVEDTSCGSSTVADQCTVNRYNNRQCTWNGTCKDRTCENAATDIIGHDACSTYSKLCTGKANNAGGCQNRTCDNAPTTITSNSGCEDYLPNKNCIAKKDGGCVTNTTCQAILLKDACVKDLNGKDCYWDSVAGNCLDKTCASLPSRINNHTDCNKEINTCTVNSSGTCVDLLCENIIDKENCTKDKDAQECIYYGSCFQKQCSSASQSFTTHAECQDYLETCTVTNAKKGCMDLPLTCSALTIKDNCELKANKDKCGWTGSICIDIACTTAPTKVDDEYTIELCEAYKPNSNCVPNTLKKGCVELPVKCDLRKIKEQCDVAGTKTNGGKTCLWDGDTLCYEKTCANATKEGNALSVVKTDGAVAHNDCLEWLKDDKLNPLCIVGTGNDACAPIPSNCSGLGKNSCLNNLLKVPNTDPVEYQNCFWNDTTKKCVDGNVCANIDKTTHGDCTTASNKKCTVSADEQKCVDRLSCSQYTKSVQCQKDKNDAPCSWDAQTEKCSDTVCLATVEDTKSFDTHTECTNKSNQCTVTNLPCGLKKATCSNYGNELACVGGKLGDQAQCSWDSVNSVCEDVPADDFDCTKIKGAKLTGKYCNNAKATCSVNAAGNSCITGQENCSGQTQANCKWSLVEGDCYFINSACKAVSTLKCSELSGSTDAECRTLKSSCIFGASGKCKPNCASLTEPQTFDSCQNFDSECSVQNDGKSCYYIDKNCSLLTTNTCTKGKDGYCQRSGSNCAKVTINSATCANVTMSTQGAAKITAKYCKEISAGACTAKSDQTVCAVIAAECGDYTGDTLTQCYYATEGYCHLDSSNNCIKYEVSTACTVKLGGEPNLNLNICQEFSNTCTVDGSNAKQCSNYSSTPLTCSDFKGIYNFFNCYHFLQTCSVNAAGTACITKQDNCGGYTDSPSCGYALIQGPCVWDATLTPAAACVQKSCDAITVTDVAIASIDACSAKQQNCTVRTGGCMKRVACSAYTKKEQCVENSTSGKCIWNSTSNKCFDRTCSNADSTYNTHLKCLEVGNCTVKLGEDGSTLAGCINLTACSDYKVADQCKKNASKKDCEWSLVETPNKCVDKTCASADPATYTDFEDCQGYIFEGNCTLGAKKNEDGTFTEGGCQALALCSEYNTANQCKKSKNKDTEGNFLNCYWNDSTKKCGDASCGQADDTFTTHDACATYGNPMKLKCTVDKDDKGCVPIPDTCEGMSKGQCVDVDSKLNKCIWIEVAGNGSCVTRTCENAVSPTNSSDCKSHLFYCTMIDTGSKCKTKVCEDYNYTDDIACAALFKDKKCTTNGKFCVNRGSCALALSQKGCTTDSSGNACEWIVPTDTTKIAYCTLKTCNTAPKDYTSESQCLQYFTPKPPGATCTTQQGGGCVQRSTCSAAQVQAACTSDQNGFICAWDSDTSKCRNQECKDISGTTHAACQNPTDKNFKGKCTAGKGGKCALMQTCGLTTVEAACVVGTDGPCIWLPDYPNTDSNTKGACFLYDSCRSLLWNSDPLCKYISDKCTTNGKLCIGITQCAKTNVDGGCVTGTDGECITSVQTLGAANKVCTKYVSCNSALFTTHNECFNANPKCTTNGTSSCIELAACSTYVKEACRYNKDGVQLNSSKQITSTGKCQWDETTSACRDQNCSDLKGANHNACSSQLITCTSDGTNCITKDSCTKYTTNSTCINSLGIEGLCTWVEGTGGAAGTCRVKTCDDITGGTSALACSIVDSCTTDGTKCIIKGTCDKYLTKAGCNSRGTDGICVWTETTTGTTTTGKCSLMTNCAAASKDSNACQQAFNRCKWTSGTATSASSCVDHTCETYNSQTGKCTYFSNWDSTKYTICRNVAGKCTPADPKTLLESECYTQSAYMYSWNTKLNACTQCGASVVSPNNSTNGNNTNNNNGSTSTDSGYVLGVAVLLGYLMY
ncbi:unnamed protein product [Paramecium pentaurelia]|uniref:PSI domain-containing protein n=1 Tax=Paramecium pentaurelia TaxID=43138 RepID=A0A8S1XJZ3_9CILI|nr:unnamed protein product [Paramecium pentaurelia]